MWRPARVAVTGQLVLRKPTEEGIEDIHDDKADQRSG
jgi:hypothetical protein